MRSELSVLLAGALLAGCDLDQSVFYQAAIEDVPGVVDLGFITPVDLTTVTDLAEEVIYGEVGPTGTTRPGGVTFNFTGTGGSVCVFVDPELVSWNQSVSEAEPIRNFSYPDNIYDDGDLDLYGGLSVYYTGTPGQVIGDFEVPYRDDLGNVFVQDLFECIGTVAGGRGGRGIAEACYVPNTVPGVSYTIVLQTFSVPIDDNRLGYGLLLTQGDCSALNDAVGSAIEEQYARECVIRGESIRPGQGQGARAAAAGLPSPSWIGFSEVAPWEESLRFENAFCNETLRGYCTDEANVVDIQGDVCSWEVAPEDVIGPARRCYCGDPDDTPTGGGF